jgi:hypothetical protein
MLLASGSGLARRGINDSFSLSLGRKVRISLMVSNDFTRW